MQDDWFRRQLLSCCQKMFEAGTNDMTDVTGSMTPEAMERKRLKNKQKILGNVNFIGQLFLSDLLPGKIITDHVIGFLLNIREDPARQCTENDMEAVCNLFITIGEKMESAQNQQRYKKKIDKYFEVMEKHVAAGMSPRIKFMLMNLKDVRKKGWKDPKSKKKTAAAPKRNNRQQQNRMNGGQRGRRAPGRQRQRMKVQTAGGQVTSQPQNVWSRGRGAVDQNISFADKLKKQRA